MLILDTFLIGNTYTYFIQLQPHVKNNVDKQNTLLYLGKNEQDWKYHHHFSSAEL